MVCDCVVELPGERHSLVRFCLFQTANSGGIAIPNHRAELGREQKDQTANDQVDERVLSAYQPQGVYGTSITPSPIAACLPDAHRNSAHGRTNVIAAE